MRLPEPFIENVTHVLGDDGRAWLDALGGTAMVWGAADVVVSKRRPL